MFYKVSMVIEKDEHEYHAYCPELETLTEPEKMATLSEEILTTVMGIPLSREKHF